MQNKFKAIVAVAMLGIVASQVTGCSSSGEAGQVPTTAAQVAGTKFTPEQEKEMLAGEAKYFAQEGAALKNATPSKGASAPAAKTVQ
jgi:hypothetical protein